VSRMLVLPIGLAALLMVAGAQAGTSPSLTLHASSPRVLYGHGVTLSGRVTGGVVAGKTVVIDARPYGTSAPHPVAAVSTTPAGTWSYRMNPTIQTSYQAHIGAMQSPGATVGVAPRVTVTELGNGRLRAEVGAMNPFTHRLIELQQRAADGTWKTIDRRRLSAASIAVFSPKVGTSTIRIAMSINQAGAGYLGAASHALTYRAELLTMKPSALRVEYGRVVTLTGRLVNGQPGTRVAIFARRYGTSVPARIATLTTGSNGGFSLTVRPKIRTVYRAAVAGLQSPAGAIIGVQPMLTVHQLGGGKLVVTASAGKDFVGRSVQLQRMSGNAWTTVAKRQLGHDSTTVFTLHLPDSMVRLAMSVNQAGAGYLGSTSHPLSYRAV
jgi:hypothetical protein